MVSACPWRTHAPNVNVDEPGHQGHEIHPPPERPVVVVKNTSGAAVSGAVVSATWARPGGATVTQTATTSSTGIAKFSTTGGRGRYTLTVSNISKTGYTFDAANSALTKGITK